MPNKNTKTARRTKGKAMANIPAVKDDGTRWIVVDTEGNQVYLGSGLMKAEAERLATGLVAKSGIRQITPS